jgi:hypothetical protein
METARMGLLDILSQYAGSALPQAGTPGHFDEAASQSASGDLGSAISAMLRSDATPAFGQAIGGLFGQSNPAQQAGVLNQILQTIGPAALGAAGGVLGRILGGAGTAGTVPTITPEQASQLSPEQVREIAAHAERHDPSIIDSVGNFYAAHPGLVQSLGAAALAVGLSHLHSRQ